MGEDRIKDVGIAVAEKVLGERQTVRLAPGKPDEEGDGAGATGQPGRFRVEEQRPSQIIRCQAETGGERTDAAVAIVRKPFPAHGNRPVWRGFFDAIGRQTPTLPPPKGGGKSVQLRRDTCPGTRGTAGV